MANNKEMTYFHGTMGSAKTLRLILDEHQQRVKKHQNTLIIKPADDTKGAGNIKTGYGDQERPALIMPSDAEATEFILDQTSKLLGNRAWTLYLDEINFFTPEQILSVRENIVDEDIADVKMYGLVLDAFGRLFPGSLAALTYADKIVQLENTCDNDSCDRPAIHNARIVGGQIIHSGPQIAIDGIDASYMSLCHKDFSRDIVRPQEQ